ncbi:serine--tRNA ligase, partial [bacterium]|nr:serine--tRNA ligase [bacterium]
MLDIKFIRENTEAIEKFIHYRKMQNNIPDFIQLDEERRKLLKELEELKHERNLKSKEVAKLFREKDDIQINLNTMKELSIRIKKLQKEFKELDFQLNDIVSRIPNILHYSVPRGLSPEENQVIRVWGEKPVFQFNPITHWELGEILGILDFERSKKISKNRFVLYMDFGAKLERALLNFMLDYHTKKNGYTEINTPFMVNSKSVFGTGHLPFGEDELYRCTNDDLYLVTTAEIPITNMHREETLEEGELPKNYVAYSPCFRKEAGSYGKDTKGLIRCHQFNKVELVKFTKPQDSYEDLEKITQDAESILKELKLPYRVVSLCSGTLDPAASKSYDIEVWIPTQNRYREISTCSNYEDYQARRIETRYKPSFEKSEYLHTLNASGLAIG